ncbi:hypothetical protein LEMLEM_LOCUS7270 [Lemmus lemmus]
MWETDILGSKSCPLGKTVTE